MAKRLFLLILISFVSIFIAPEFLMASDTVELTALNDAKIVETIPIVEVEPEPEPEPVSSPVVEPVNKPAAATVAAPAYVAPVMENYITVGGKTIEIFDSGDTAIDAGKHVARYNNGSFLYGHNSSEVFRALYWVNRGEIFSVTYGGVTTNYRVEDRIVYRKTDAYNLKVDDDSSYINGHDVPMKYVASGYDERGGKKYSVALMTCYGESYGDGDASHRLVIFANAI